MPAHGVPGCATATAHCVRCASSQVISNYKSNEPTFHGHGRRAVVPSCRRAVVPSCVVVSRSQSAPPHPLRPLRHPPPPPSSLLLLLATATHDARHTRIRTAAATRELEHMSQVPNPRGWQLTCRLQEQEANRISVPLIGAPQVAVWHEVQLGAL
jgi:hypothetical protein